MRTMPRAGSSGTYSCSSSRLSGSQCPGCCVRNDSSVRRSSRRARCARRCRPARASAAPETGSRARAPGIASTSLNVQIRGRRHAELAQQRRLRRLAEFQREGVRAVQHAHAAELQRTHVRQRVRHGARVAPHVARRARLVEIERRERRIGVRERGPLEVDRTSAKCRGAQRLEQRLLPLRVLEKDGEIGGVSHGGWSRRAGDNCGPKH